MSCLSEARSLDIRRTLDVRRVGTQGGTFTSTLSPSISVPAGTQDGDIAVVAVATDTTHLVDAPTGWVDLGTQDAGTDSSVSAILRVCSGEGATWTLTNLFNTGGGASESGAIVAAVYRNVDNVQPLDVAAVSSSGSTTTPGGTITPITDRSMLLLALGADPGADPYSLAANTPAGSALAVSSQNALTGIVGIIDYLLATAGAQTITAAASSDNWGRWGLALRPDGRRLRVIA